MEYICSYCKKICKNKNSLVQHECRCEKNINRKPMITIKCKVCGLVVGKNNFKRHMSIHDITVSKKDRDFQIKNIFVCSFCYKRWKTTVTGYKVHEKFCYLNPNRSYRSLGEDGRRKVGKASKQRKAGGYKVGILGGKGKRGYYKGYYCMSSWELAWLVYQLDHNKEVKQCRVQFDYEFNGKKRKYTPDFIINDIFYEIKNWHRPDTDAKIEAVKKNRFSNSINRGGRYRTLFRLCKDKIW